MLETEDHLNHQENCPKTIETGTFEETIEASKENNKNSKNKNKKDLEISITDENNKKYNNKKPKTKLTKTISSL